MATEEHRVRESIGVVFQEHTIDEYLTAYENLYYHCALYKVPRKERKERIDDMLNTIGLWDRKNHLVKTFSGGMKRRIEIVRSLLHYPQLLILDEPTVGIDVGSKAEIHKLIRELAEQGIAVLVISSEMPEIMGVSDRILTMHQGEITAQFEAAEATEDKLIKGITGIKEAECKVS